MTYLESKQIKFRNRSHLTIEMDPNSTPGHRNSIPFPTLSREGKVGNFHHLCCMEA